ncbi:MAG: guanosine polyphosphate pyrophosphohydrolase [Lachnospiraceae bacterium]
MVKLDDYLYNGDTVLKILYNYQNDLRKNAGETGNRVDMAHCNFLLQISGLLERNDFLSDQAGRIKEYYRFMVKEYPFLAFTFRGRIKSLIRAEEKFNGYIVEYVHDYYLKYHSYPTADEIRSRLKCFRDLIAYRIVISLPKCHKKEDENIEEAEIKYLYQIANQLPVFLEERGFTAEIAGMERGMEAKVQSPLLNDEVRPYFRDYVANPKPGGYRALHITFFDNSSRVFAELQLRTKAMDDYAEIGPANHMGYEQKQDTERSRRADIPEGECVYFDEAYLRGIALQKLQLAKLDVNMFGATNNSLVNDGCGLYRGRSIQPFEHLSRFQNDLD